MFRILVYTILTMLRKFSKQTNWSYFININSFRSLRLYHIHRVMHGRRHGSRSRHWRHACQGLYSLVPKLEVTIARKVLPHPQGIKGSIRNLLNKGLFLWSRFARMRYEARWFQWHGGTHVFGGAKGSTFPTNRKIFPDNNILKLSPPPNHPPRRQLFRWKIFLGQ
jgi:hypothetical protein